MNTFKKSPIRALPPHTETDIKQLAARISENLRRGGLPQDELYQLLVLLFNELRHQLNIHEDVILTNADVKELLRLRGENQLLLKQKAILQNQVLQLKGLGHHTHSSSDSELVMGTPPPYSGDYRPTIQIAYKPRPTAPPESQTNGGSSVEGTARDFYFPAPSEDGSFAVNLMSETLKKGVSVFRVSVGKDVNTGSITLLNDPGTIRKVLGLPDSYLEPVCQGANAHGGHVSNVVVIEEGTLARTADKWIVKKKMKIRYE